MFTVSSPSTPPRVLQGAEFTTQRRLGVMGSEHGMIGRMPYTTGRRMQLLQSIPAIRNVRQELVLCHFDGANNATSWTEVHGATCSSTSPSKLTTTDKKFGATSIILTPNNGADFVITPSLSIDVANQDWTFEYFLKLNSGDTTFDVWMNSIRMEFQASTGACATLINLVGGASVTKSFGVTLGVWCHVAMCRSSNDLYFASNGIMTKYANVFTALDKVAANNEISSFTSAGTSSAYIDEMRLTRGFAYYTANFTPPSAPFT